MLLLLHCLSQLQQLMTPELVGDEVIYAAFEALADAAEGRKARAATAAA